MHATKIAVVVLIGGLGVFLASTANSQDKTRGAAATTTLECKDKYYTNLPGQNAFLLRKEKDGTFTAVAESYGKPRTYPELKCIFHSKDRKVFYCSNPESLWGVEGQHVQSTSVATDGSEKAFDGYEFQVVKYPLGEPTTTFNIQFDAAKCVGPK